MNPELQTLVDRLELLERQGRGWRLVALLALLLAATALALPYLKSTRTGGATARFGVVEANRFLVRDLDGTVAGALESRPDGSLRLMLGGRSGGSAHLVLPRAGAPQFTLRGPDGRVRMGLDGSDHPGLWLSQDGRYSQVALGTTPAAGGVVWVRDAEGRPRFHAP